MTDKTGIFVIYLDEHKQVRDALVTADWNKTIDNGPINIVIVSTDINKEDQYGRQLERKTSIGHITQGYEELKANCWMHYSEWVHKYAKIIM